MGVSCFLLCYLNLDAIERARKGDPFDTYELFQSGGDVIDAAN